MNLSITRAWDETVSFVKQEAGTLFLIVFALAVLPGLILQAVAGRLVGDANLAPAAAADPASLTAAALAIPLMLIPILALSIWGNLTITLLAMRRETVIGSAFRHAARRILPLLGAALLFGLAAAVIAVPVIGAAGIGMGMRRLGLAMLLLLVLMLLAIFFAIRLMLMTPIAAAEPLGPIGIIRRSWQLTAGHFWKLLGFFILLLIVFLVVFVVINSIGGILMTMTAGQPKPGTVGSFVLQLVTGIVQAVWATYFVVLMARIYQQLAGDTESVAQVFK